MTSQQAQLSFVQISKYSLRLDLGSVKRVPPAGPECTFARPLNCLNNGDHFTLRSAIDAGKAEARPLLLL
jgi:hypothetical protein